MLGWICQSLLYSSRLAVLVAKPRMSHRAARSMSTPDRSYPLEPRVGVGVVILRPAPSNPQVAEILLIKRGKAPSKGLWSFPGGSQELGKPLCSASLSAAQGGLAFSKLLQVPTPFAAADVITHDNKNKIEYHYTIVEVAAVPDDPEAVPEAASDVDDIKWAAVSSLRQHKDLVLNAARIAEEASDRFELTR